jgi:hypothetical protein
MQSWSADRNLGRPEDLAANRQGTITDEQRRAALGLNWGSGCVVLIVALVAGALLVPLATAALADFMQGAVAFGAVLVILPIVLFTGWMVMRWWLVRQDLAAGQISLADGEVRWRQHRYAAEFPDRPRWASNSVTSLAPGAYRFYYLPRSGHVLSAEPLPAMSILGAESGLNQTLRRVHGFSQADLEANREGRLGAGQALRLLLSAGGLALVTLVVVGLIGTLAWGIFADNEGSPIGLAFGLIGVIVGLMLGWTMLKLMLDLFSGRVEQASGVGTRSIRPAGRSTTYYYHIGGQRFTVSYRGYQALVPDQVYRLYYVPRSRRLVGIEAAER